MKSDELRQKFLSARNAYGIAIAGGDFYNL